MTSTLQVNYTSIKFKINNIYIFLKIASHMCTLEKSLWLYIGKYVRGKSGDKETGGMEIRRTISILSRGVASGNGGWL